MERTVKDGTFCAQKSNEAPVKILWLQKEPLHKE